MGDFSRDPKDRLTDSVVKHYVGVRMQQGVPILDADWNELEDLRRHELESVGGRWIGNGVPAGNDGFRIMSIDQDNNLAITKGVILVKGKAVTNDNDCNYLNQPNASMAPAVTTPVSDRSYVAYLDVWEREVDAGEDDKLVDVRIGVETCVRLKREWVVRMAEGTTLPAEPQGHIFCLLAIIKRKGGQARITFEMITDERRLMLTLAETTKAPLALFGPLGNQVYTMENFGILTATTEKAYFNLLNSDLFMTGNFVSATPLETVMLGALFNGVMQTARAASLQAGIRNLDNRDGLKVLEMLYHAQRDLETSITPFATGLPGRISTLQFIERLQELLDGGTGGIPPGLKKAVTDQDLAAAIKAQEDINREIGTRTQILPHGHLALVFMSGPPVGTIITAGQTYRYEYRVTFERTGPGPVQTETFDILPAMSPPGWTVTLVNNAARTVTLDTEESVVVQADVKIPVSGAVTSSRLNMRVRSRLNPTEMDTTNADALIEVGSGSVQPSPLKTDLLSPAINVAVDVVSIGRGVPIGLPGKAKLLRFRFSHLTPLGTQKDFTVRFAFTPAGAFDAISDSTIQLGGAAGLETTRDFTCQASAASVNGTNATLSVRIEQVSDTNIDYEMSIKVKVQK